MDSIANQFISHATHVAIVGIVGYLVTSAKAQTRKYSAMENGLKALLRDRIISACNKVIDRDEKFLYMYEHENISKMFTEYTNLGGNSTVSDIVTPVLKFPIKTSLK